MDNYLCIRSINLMIAQTAEFILLGLRHARGVVERRFLGTRKEEGEERRKSPSPVRSFTKSFPSMTDLQKCVPSTINRSHCLHKAFFIPFSEEQQVQASKKI